MGYSELSEKFGIGKSTITTLKKNEAKIREFTSTLESKSVWKSKSHASRKGQRTRSGSVSLVCTKTWHRHALNGTILWHFFNRHGIRGLRLQGEKLSADTKAPEPFKKELQDVMEREGLTLEQIYNCDETGLYYKMLPTKNVTTKAEKNASGVKKQKERVTLMACSNVSGSHKLPFLFIGKAANPRCFKHVNKAALPVVYKCQKNAWANTAIFTDWFNCHFIPSVKSI